MNEENTLPRDPGQHMLWAVAASIVLVNVLSIYGQVEWFAKEEHLPLIGAVGAAVSLESIALALSAMAHHAMIAGDSAWTLALGSRGMSIVAGLINLSHYSAHGIAHPSTLGIVFGLLSSSSGFMWGALAKRQARDKFLEQGVLERRTVKVGAAMWALYPREALERLRVGVWHGENRLAEVRRMVEEKREQERAGAGAEPVSAPSPALALTAAPGPEAGAHPAHTVPLTESTARTTAELVRVAMRDHGARTGSEIARFMSDHGRPISEQHARRVRADIEKEDADRRRSVMRAVPAQAIGASD